jgi:hypothetical protein
MRQPQCRRPLVGRLDINMPMTSPQADDPRGLQDLGRRALVPTGETTGASIDTPQGTTRYRRIRSLTGRRPLFLADAPSASVGTVPERRQPHRRAWSPWRATPRDVCCPEVGWDCSGLSQLLIYADLVVGWKPPHAEAAPSGVPPWRAPSSSDASWAAV